MPVLSLNFGQSKFSILYLNSENVQSYWIFDYTYQKSLYSHFYSKEQFYTDAINHFIKTNKISSKDLAVITTGSNIPITIGNDITFSAPIEDLLKNEERYNVILFERENIFTQNTTLTYTPNKDFTISSRERDFLVNYEFYKNIKPTNLSQYEAMLSTIYNLLVLQKNIFDRVKIIKPLLFLGDIFNQNNNEFKNLGYFYLLSLLTNKGVYKLNLDEEDKYIHYLLLSMYNSQYRFLVDEYKPISLGTLVNFPQETTCLIKNELNTPQLIDLKSGQLFFLPLDSGTSTQINVKSGADVIEQSVDGGRLGLIIDTRVKDPAHYSNESLKKDFELNMKNLQEALARI